MGRGAGLWRLGQPTVRYAGRCRESGLRHLRLWAYVSLVERSARISRSFKRSNGD